MQALIVEDDIALRTLYDRVLTQLGYEVTLAQNGEEAIEILSHETPTLMFLDMLMPMVNGIQVLEFMAEQPQLADTHVVIVSSAYETERHTTIVPSSEFILKPVRPSQIKEIAERFLK